jgi:hypothetical protein
MADRRPFLCPTTEEPCEDERCSVKFCAQRGTQLSGDAARRAILHAAGPIPDLFGDGPNQAAPDDKAKS